MRLGALLSLVLALCGCPGPLARLTTTETFTAATATWHLRSDGTREAELARVRQALKASTPALEVWGGLEQPVTVFLLGTHDELERAVGRSGYDWLKAWARYDDVILQAPSTWATRSGEFEELVTHELTHCVLFQRAGTPQDWAKKQIPLWFREGMAQWTARQGRFLPSLEDAAQWLERHPERDVFRDGEVLSEHHYAPVYGFSLHAFTFLERRYGLERLRAVLAAMKQGLAFEPAFERGVGTSVERFRADFRSFLRFRAFRGEKRGSAREREPRPNGDRPGP